MINMKQEVARTAVRYINGQYDHLEKEVQKALLEATIVSLALELDIVGAAVPMYQAKEMLNYLKDAYADMIGKSFKS